MARVTIPSGRYIVAVSGGVDSVVLLNLLASRPDLELIVAHFDHGIRSDSNLDATFVSELAKSYGLKCEIKREELGENASEDTARTRRYEFLREVTKKYSAKLITAHHADDVIETVAINLSRGTGWRGLAVLDSDVLRPLTCFIKSEIIDYANNHGLKWREDSTNDSDKYLRNRIRQQTNNLSGDKKQKILELWTRQKILKKAIDEEVDKLIGEAPAYSRYFFINIDSVTAIECLRGVVKARLTRPQLTNTLYMIKTALPDKDYYAGDGVKISFTSRNFTVELLK